MSAKQAFLVSAGLGVAAVVGLANLGLERDPCTSEIDAALMAQVFVADRLISPSTAEFPWTRDQTIAALGDCRFAISSYVDSQNAFGAVVRSAYTAQIQYRPSTKKWHLENVSILP